MQWGTCLACCHLHFVVFVVVLWFVSFIQANGLHFIAVFCNLFFHFGMLFSFCLDVLLSFLIINWYFFLYFPCLCMIVCFVAVFSFGCAVVFCICPLFLLLFVFCLFVYDCVSLWFLVFCDLLGMLLSFLFLHGLFHLSK